MTTAWIQYWRPEQLAIERDRGDDGEPFEHTAGEQFAGITQGDAVYVLGRSGSLSRSS